MEIFKSLSVIVILCVFLLHVFTGQSFGAEQSSEYLKYHEPQNGSSSLLLTVGYLLFLIIVFILVIGLAYVASRLVGQKMGAVHSTGENKILAHLSFGSNRAVYVVEIAGRVLVLGVTDHAINLLQEITSTEDIEKIKNQSKNVMGDQFSVLFQKQLVSLQKMSNKFPGVFGSDRIDKDKSSVDKENR